MKKLLFIALLWPSYSLAAPCPQYTYPTVPGLDQDMANICHDINYPTVNNGTASSMTITNVTFSNPVALIGVTNGSNATAGNIGEWQGQAEQSVTTGGSGQFTNVAQITLTAGDWDLSGVLVVNLTIGTPNGNSGIALSAYSNNTITDHVLGDNEAYSGDSQNGGGQYVSLAIPSWRVNITSGGTYYLKGYLQFTGSGTGIFSGRISARRVR